MSFVNYGSREVNCKVVYCGPGLSGKTTNLQHVHARVDPATRGKLISLTAGRDRTLFFDFLPVELGNVRGFKTRFHLFTVPGQAFYNQSRKLILRNADGLVFVADSQIERLEANLESLESLEAMLAEQGQTLSAMPLAIQYNKRDLPNVVPVPDLDAALNPHHVPAFPSCAIKGEGVFETLKGVAKLVLEEVRKKML
ncbi:MAG: ATP/GTP-binding protein [Candidatus Methylomirabilales bacterium]